MQRLKHPQTGETVHASRATAERLAEDGWENLSTPATEPATGGADGSERPAKNASREDWNSYAETLGLDPEDYSSKDELIDAVDQAEQD